MKWKLQFSLSSLLWLTLCFALLVTSILMYRGMVQAERRAAQAQEEAANMQQAAGYLTIGDRKLVHASFAPTKERFTWKWRLFLPPERHFVLKSVVGEIPSQGMPEGEPCEHVLAESGAIAIYAEIRQTEDKNWQLVLSYSDQKLDVNGYYGSTHAVIRTFPVSSSVMEKLSKVSETYTDPNSKGFGFINTILGISGTETAEPDKTIILLRERLYRRLGQGRWTDLPEPMPGTMIWLEEKK